MIGGVCAQETFVFKDKSKIYDVRVGFEKCDDGEREAADDPEPKKVCNDRATFYLSKKEAASVFQVIEMDETFLALSGVRRKKGDVTELYGKRNAGVYFADYNFDGIEDLVLGNGSYRPYGGISNDVFLFSKTQGKFVKNAELSRMESENMLVDVNKKLKYIETQTKSGCWHEKARYRFVNNRLQKFYVYTEDAASANGKWVSLITERLVGGKWRKTTQKVLIKKTIGIDSRKELFYIVFPRARAAINRFARLKSLSHRFPVRVGRNQPRASVRGIQTVSCALSYRRIY